MDHTTNGRSEAAVEHLRLIARDRMLLSRAERHVVPLAFIYGLTVEQIARYAMLEPDRVRRLVLRD
ncbi:hypothetical protein [Herbiconiux sp. UC225_62]|uniref:hypothetical protein n=1 Tax=Herbiconiux sp. UC225_62 TaxID=3350168 RepID=UPI0036D277E7